MGGGLMQLVAYGAQDIYLTGNPQITFFKVVYRRHTNFAVEAIEQTINGTVGAGSPKVSVTIARNGDLLSRTYVILNNNGATNKGFDAIEYVEVEVGGQVIDKHYGAWMKIWCDLTHGVDKKTMLNNMLCAGDDCACGTESKNTQSVMPLQFWFCRNPGLALPLIALQYHEVKLNIKFCDLTHTAAVAAVAAVPAVAAIAASPGQAGVAAVTAVAAQAAIALGATTAAGDAVTPRVVASMGGIANITGLQGGVTFQFAGATSVAVAGLTDAIVATGLVTLSAALVATVAVAAIGATAGVAGTPFVPAILAAPAQAAVPAALAQSPIAPTAEVWCDYIFLDTDERRRFAQVSHEYLIEQVQYNNGVSATGGSIQHELRFNHPVKELIWTTPSGAHCCHTMASEGEVCDALLQLNGHDRFRKRNGFYFSDVQRYEHHTGARLAGVDGDGTNCVDAGLIYTYSFGLKPEEHQPSGTCNFSRIDNAVLSLGFHKANTARSLNVYAVNYNVLRIMSGMGGLAYSN